MVTVYGTSVIEVQWKLPYTQRTIIAFKIYASNNEPKTILGDAITVGNVTNLQPSTMYTITVAAVFLGNLEGNMSLPMFATTMDVVSTS